MSKTQFTFIAANLVNTSLYTRNRKYGTTCAATSRQRKKPLPSPPARTRAPSIITLGEE